MFHHPLIHFRFLTGFFSLGIAAAGLSAVKGYSPVSEDENTVPEEQDI
jgi:hypothetical protein